ncbi:hypothetical protein AB834_06500 [PVC group bacterium (ex Bugula neritina AB1)]|nr:hypothetical protein AB834_06500 [PVC group bacterium (ex Bugula neritina AB1)]
MKKSYLEIKVGIFIIFALFLFVVGIFFVQDIKLFSDQREVKVLFKHTNGLEVGAPACYSGVRVGEVNNIRILYDENMVEVAVGLNDKVVLTESTIISINSWGIMGEKYVEFIMGEGDPSLLIDESLPLIGQNPVLMSDMVRDFKEFSTKVNKMLNTFNDILSNPETQKNIKSTIEQTARAAEHLSELTEMIFEALKSNKNNFKKTIDSINNTSFSINNNMLILEKLLQRIEEGEGFIGKLISDESLYLQIEELIEDISYHPWKLLIKTKKKKKKKEKEKEKEKKEKIKIHRAFEKKTRALFPSSSKQLLSRH